MLPPFHIAWWGHHFSSFFLAIHKWMWCKFVMLECIQNLCLQNLCSCSPFHFAYLISFQVREFLFSHTFDCVSINICIHFLLPFGENSNYLHVTCVFKSIRKNKHHKYNGDMIRQMMVWHSLSHKIQINFQKIIGLAIRLSLIMFAKTWSYCLIILIEIYIL